MKSEVPVVGPGEGEHDGAPDAAVLQPDAVTNLMGQGLQEVHAPVRVQSPVLRVVHVDVPHLGVISMGQCASGPVKRVSVQVVVSEKVYRYVNFTARLLVKYEVCDVTPVSEGFLDC